MTLLMVDLAKHMPLADAIKPIAAHLDMRETLATSLVMHLAAHGPEGLKNHMLWYLMKLQTTGDWEYVVGLLWLGRGLGVDGWTYRLRSHDHRGHGVTHSGAFTLVDMSVVNAVAAVTQVADDDDRNRR
jgi:hypothetical protein